MIMQHEVARSLALEMCNMRLLRSESEQNTGTKTVPLPDHMEEIMADGNPIKFGADEIEIITIEDKSTYAMSPYVDGQKKRDEIARDDDGREVHLLFDVTARWVKGLNKGMTQKVTVRFDREAKFVAGDVLASDGDEVVYTASGRKSGDFVNMSATIDSPKGWSVSRNMWADEDIDYSTGSKSDYSAV